MTERPFVPLFQAELSATPFWMVVGCQLVNRASWAQAGPILMLVRCSWPTPARLADADAEDLRAVLRPLGFVRTRAERLKSFAAHWVHLGPPAYAETLLERPGCGVYARDSWAIFIEGRTDVRPTDKRLREHLRHHAQTEQGHHAAIA